MQNENEEMDDFQKFQAQLADKWVPFSEFSKMLLNSNFCWIYNSKYKYVNVTIDTRDMKCCVSDREGNETEFDGIESMERVFNNDESPAKNAIP